GLPEHRSGEDIHARTSLEQVQRNVTAADVRRGAEPGLPVSSAPVPGGIDQLGFAPQQLLHDVDVAVRLENELVHKCGIECGLPVAHQTFASSFSFFASSMIFCAMCEGTSS